MSKHEHEEFLTPKEIRETYGLQEDEDIYKFVNKINNSSKGSRITIIKEKGDKHED